MIDTMPPEKLAERLFECDILFKWSTINGDFNEVHVEAFHGKAIKVRYIGQTRCSWIDVSKVVDILVLREKNV